MSQINLIFTPEELEHNLEMLSQAVQLRNFSPMILRLSESERFQQVATRAESVGSFVGCNVPHAQAAFNFAIGYACGQRAAEARALTNMLPSAKPEPTPAPTEVPLTFDGTQFDADIQKALADKSITLVADQFMEHCAQSEIFTLLVASAIQAVVLRNVDVSGMIVSVLLSGYQGGYCQGYRHAKEEEANG